MARRPEEDFVTRRWPAMGVRSGVGCCVVGAEIGFNLDDAASNDAGCGFVQHQKLA